MKHTVLVTEIKEAPAMRGVKSVHMMRKRYDGHTDLFMREEFTDGTLTWKIHNKGMYDEQSPTNAASLEATFQANKA